MLAKKNRLNRKEFNQLRNTGHKTNIYPYLITHNPAPIFKASVVVSKKVSKKAVTRNKLRRQIYDYLSKNFSTLKCYIIISPQNNETNFSLLDRFLSKIP